MRLNSLTFDAIAARLTDGSFDAAAKILSIAATRSTERLIYREVAEVDNAHASFDLDLHTAGIRIEEMRGLPAKTCARYVIAVEQLQTLCRRIRHRTLGHLSGGINREEGDFLTLDYPVDCL